MNKIVFEGIVNGTKYDNVERYNKAVKEALEKGEPFSASSSTKAVYVNEDVTPGFTIKDMNETKYLNDCKDKNPDQLQCELNDKLEKIKETVKDYSLAERSAYLDNIEEIMDIIRKNKSILFNTKKELEDLKKNSLHFSAVNSIFEDFYKNLKGIVSGKVNDEEDVTKKDDEEEKPAPNWHSALWDLLFNW